MSLLACDVQPDVRQAEAAGLHLTVQVDLRHWALPLSVQDLAATVRGIPLDDLLACSAIVSLHVPLTDRTRRLLDAAIIARMKSGAALGNSDTPLDRTALHAVLQTGRLRSAAFDVLEQDERHTLLAPPDGSDEAGPIAPERRHLDVVVSSRAARTSDESIRRSAIVTVKLVGRFMEGHPMEEGAIAGR